MTETDRKTYIQRDRDKETDRQSDRDRQTYREKETDRETETNRQRETETDTENENQLWDLNRITPQFCTRSAPLTGRHCISMRKMFLLLSCCRSDRGRALIVQSHCPHVS